MIGARKSLAAGSSPTHASRIAHAPDKASPTENYFLRLFILSGPTADAVGLRLGCLGQRKPLPRVSTGPKLAKKESGQPNSQTLKPLTLLQQYENLNAISDRPAAYLFKQILKLEFHAL
jgi:hypothetical protein